MTDVELFDALIRNLNLDDHQLKLTADCINGSGNGSQVHVKCLIESREQSLASQHSVPMPFILVGANGCHISQPKDGVPVRHEIVKAVHEAKLVGEPKQESVEAFVAGTTSLDSQLIARSQVRLQLNLNR